MKTLHLIRHAKSSWADPLLADFDRPLKKRGLSDALLVAPAAAAAGWRSDSVYCSGAARARQTIAQFSAVLHQELSKVQYRDELYTFDYRDLIDWLKQQGDSELTIVGHNPALQELIEWFAGQSLEKFPTCAYCKLQIDSDSWREISPGSASILTLLTPENVETQLIVSNSGFLGAGSLGAVLSRLPGYKTCDGILAANLAFALLLHNGADCTVGKRARLYIVSPLNVE